METNSSICCLTGNKIEVRLSVLADKMALKVLTTNCFQAETYAIFFKLLCEYVFNVGIFKNIVGLIFAHNGRIRHHYGTIVMMGGRAFVLAVHRLNKPANDVLVRGGCFFNGGAVLSLQRDGRMTNGIGPEAFGDSVRELEG